jgi:hypothetical protein
LSQADKKVYLSVLTPTSLCQIVFDEETKSLSKLFTASIADADSLGDNSILTMAGSPSQVAFIGKRITQLFNWSIGKINRVSQIAVPKGESDWCGGAFVGDTLLLWTRVSRLQSNLLS